MSTRLPDIGGVPSSVDGELRRFLTRLTEHIQELQGFRGDRAGRALTGTSSGTGGGTVVIPGAPPPAPAPGPADPPDLTPPPTPSGVDVLAGIDFIGITTDPPIFTQGHGYARTRVYGIVYDPGPGPTPNPLPTFGSAVLQHEFVGQVGSFPVEPAQQWHIWVTWLTRDGVESAIPAGGTNGYQVTTGQDIERLLEVLTGQITESQLFAALGARIALIDGSMPGSVNARIATEAATRSAADSANAASISTVAARLDTGGDVANAIVAVQTSATAAQTTANGAVTTANAAASQVTTVQSVLSNATGNRVRNSSFDVDTNANGLADGFAPYNNSGMAVTASLPPGRNGGVCQRLNFTGPANNSQQGLFVDGPNPAWEPNRVYVLSAYSRSPVADGQRGRTLQLRWNTPPATIEQIVNPPLSGEFQRYAWRLTWGNTVEPNGRLFITSNEAGAARNGVLDFDDLMVQEGANLTSYEASRDINTLAASVQQEITTRVSETGYLGAQYTLRVTAGNIIGGFGISGSSAPGAQPTIAFGIRANQFFIAPPEGSPGGIPNILPFVVQTTPVTTPAGEFLPAGVYMDAAYIRNLEVALGRFQNAIITNAMIVSVSASRITAGQLAVGSYIQSSGYSVGGVGFRIGGDGYVDIANAGRTRVFNLQASGTQPIIRAGTAFEVRADGSASFAGDITSNNANLRGSLRGGAYSGYAWPAAGNYGFYLGPEGLLLGNFNNGTYIQMTAAGDLFAPGFQIVGGVAQLTAASIIGSLSFGNIGGFEEVATPTASTSLLVIGGRVSEQYHEQGPAWLSLEVPSADRQLRVQGHFTGDIRVVTNLAFAGGSLTYSLVMLVYPTVQLWDGGAWVNESFGPPVYYKMPVILTGNETLSLPVSLYVRRKFVAGSYSRARMRVRVAAVQFEQLAVNGGALKTDAMNSCFIQGEFVMDQVPA